MNIFWRMHVSTKTPIVKGPKPWIDYRQNLWTTAWMDHQTNPKARKNLWIRAGTRAGTNHGRISKGVAFHLAMPLANQCQIHALLAETSRKPRGNLAETSQKPRGNLAETSQKPRGNLAETSRKPRGNLAETSRIPRGNLAETSRKPRGNLAETLRKPRGNLAETLRKLLDL